MDGDEVGPRHQVLERGQRHSHLASPLGGDVRVVGAQPHPEGVRPLRHERTDAPQSDDAERLAVELDALPAGSLPLARDERGVGLREVAGLRQQQSHGVLGGRQDVGLRRVHHHHPAPGGGGHIDVVDADARPAHDHEVRAGLQHAGVDGGSGADDEGLGAGHRLLEVGGRQVQEDVDVVPGRSQYLDAGVGNGLGDEHAAHEAASPNTSASRRIPSVSWSSASAYDSRA